MSWLQRRRHPVAPVPLSRHSFDLIALTMAVVLALHAPHLPWWLGAGLAAVLALRWWLRRREQAKAPGWLKLPLIALLTAAIIGSYGTIFGRGPGAALAVGLLVLKLLESETPRDARVGIGFSCFTLMAALLFDQSLLVTIGVVLGLLPALAALRSLEPAQRPSGLLRQLLPGLTLLVLSLPLTLFAFLLVPRLSTPLWGAPQTSDSRTGLSDHMSPGEMTELLIDDSPAMRVTFDGPRPPRKDLYFRAYVMWRYDGHTWRAGSATQQQPAPVEGTNVLGYTVTLEPSGQRVMPTLDVPLDAPAGSTLLSEHVLVATRPINDTIAYRVRSALDYRLQPTRKSVPLLALQLPAGYNPRTLALGRQWHERYGTDTAAIVQAALSLFHDGGFRYTLTPAPLGRDAVDDFLFSTHEGFCEHYASAFTELMRAAGVPARVVTGYQGGFWNRIGNYLLVRQSDAHAWSEVWIAGRGWVRVDPTGAVRPERVSLGAAAAAAGSGELAWYQNAWLQGLRNRWDIVNRLWNQSVIGFNALRQRGLLTPFGVKKTDTRTLGLLLAAGSILFAAIGLAWAMMRRERQDPALAALRLLEARLGRVGVVRRRGEGPQHFLRRAARALPQQRQSLIGLMDSYLHLRYASNEPSPELLRKFCRSARDFRVRRVVK